MRRLTRRSSTSPTRRRPTRPSSVSPATSSTRAGHDPAETDQSKIKMARVSDAALPPAIRASDAERDATVVRLREAMAEGRLTLDDFSQRTDTALTALTRDQLAAGVA